MAIHFFPYLSIRSVDLPVIPDRLFVPSVYPYAVLFSHGTIPIQIWSTVS